MAETNKEATGQEPSDKTSSGGQESSGCQPRSQKPSLLLDLLTSILSDVQQQVQSKAAIAAPTARNRLRAKPWKRWTNSGKSWRRWRLSPNNNHADR